MIRRGFLIALLVGVGLVSAPKTALGCSCIAPDAEELLASSDGAFVGTLIEEPGPGIGIVSSADEVPYVFEIEAAYKGDLASPITVVSARDGASCGIEVPLGEKAALFINRSGNQWHGNLCAQMGSDALLDGGLPPIPFGEASPSSESNLARWVLVGLGGAAAATAGVTFVRRRRNTT